MQFRTIAMDWWASLEHKIRYKKGLNLPPELEQELVECAEEAAKLDSRIQQIQHMVESLSDPVD